MNYLPELRDGRAAFLDGDYQAAQLYFTSGLTNVANQQGLSQLHRQKLQQQIKLWSVQADIELGRYRQAEQLWELTDQDQLAAIENDERVDLEIAGAKLYSRLGKHAQAEELIRQLLDSRRKKYGCDHLLVASGLNCLGVILQANGQLTEAETVALRALSLRERLLGREHLAFAESLHNLAIIYARQDRASMAVALSKRALAIQEKALEPMHPIIGYTLLNLGMQRMQLYDTWRAQEQFMRALAILEKRLPPNHLQLSCCLSGLASCKLVSREFDQAQLLFERALNIADALECNGELDLFSAVSGLGMTYLAKRQFASAERCIRRALFLLETSAALQAAAESGLLDQLMVCCIFQGKLVDALRLYPDSMRAKYVSTFENIFKVATMLGNFADRCLGRSTLTTD